MQNRCAVSLGLFKVYGGLRHAEGRGRSIATPAGMMTGTEKQTVRNKPKQFFDEMFRNAT
jgi:hypothetical protein